MSQGMAHTPLRTVEAVFKTLGGIRAVSKLTGYRYQAVWNWKWRDQMPSEVYLVVTSALADVGHTAHPRLFRNMIFAKVD